MGVVKAVQAYRSLFEAAPTVLLGDLNSNAIWDRSHPADLNHSALIRLLDGLGLVSSYHHFFGEAQGEETRPTCYLLWKKERPYHIDYCFVPTSWATRIRQVEVGSYDSWKQHSDHRPLVVDIAAA
jgi:endonuclease/exonuclease/phosphatase family metal-dependent hydrolase